MEHEVFVVPHTHWDREWYAPFQTFRLDLVDTVDDLLDLLETDSDFSHFMLDGQMAAIDDYLEVRPEAEERICSLVQAGRLTIGPWYTLMDEFMVSGETIVRDLQLGLRRAERFGGAMRLGYLPDMFGHIAQMPQILRQFGFDEAVVWRGVPAAVQTDTFWWMAPDGSRVRATYLLDGYANGADLPQDPQQLIEIIAGFKQRNRSALTGPILWMVGSDHRPPQPELPRVVADVNASQDRFRLTITTLEDHIAASQRSDLVTWTGELRSSARANLLMGVTSNRVDIHRLCATAERQLEKLAEPLSALFLPPDHWPHSQLEIAWLEMIRNAAHDSSCACSIDEVCDAVAHRYLEATRIAEGLTTRALDALGRSVDDSGPLIVNPTARARAGVIELTVPSADSYPGTQVISRNDGVATADGLTREGCATTTLTALDHLPGIHEIDMKVDTEGVMDVTLHVNPDMQRLTAIDRVRGQIEALAREQPDGPARMTAFMPPSTTLLTWTDVVPGFGWRSWQPTEDVPNPVDVADKDSAPTITNGLVTVVVDPYDGSFTIRSGDGMTSVSGLGHVVDDGDAGDTYNWSPPPVDQVIRTPAAVRTSVIERGPLRARVEVIRTYNWPEQVFFGERIGDVATDVTTTIELQASSPVVGLTITLDNRCRDHRLRVWFPLPTEAEHSIAECAFGIVQRDLDAEGGPTEQGLATFPARRFVCAGGLTVAHDSLAEYELVDRLGDEADGPGRALALTFLRSTGMLSNGPTTMRPLPAGPFIPVDGAQVQGHHTARYALVLGDDIENAYRVADEAWVPMTVTTAPGGGGSTSSGSALQIEGAQVSSVIRESGYLVVRVFNPTDQTTTLRIPSRTGQMVNLVGTDLGRFDGSVVLGPHRIATIRLDQA